MCLTNYIYVSKLNKMSHKSILKNIEIGTASERTAIQLSYDVQYKCVAKKITKLQPSEHVWGENDESEKNRFEV